MLESNEDIMENENEFVIFLIGDQEYCIDIMSLREIRGWTSATELPDSPKYVKGVINLRGAVVPIVDLATRLGLEPSEQTERSVIMITHIGDQLVGLSADAVLDILSIKPETIQPTPQVSTHDTTRFINGLVALKDRMISVIDLVNVLPADIRDAA
jgi:purine-binding chemotaxis protein CheW